MIRMKPRSGQMLSNKGKSMTCISENKRGFTLIELCVVIAISSIVLAGIYASYRSQLASYVTQQTIVDMQQNARAAKYLMEREIRLAGYDPTGKAGASILSPLSANSITFTMDLNEDGDIADAGEKIQYAMTGDDLGRADLNTSAVLRPAALNLDALNFVYLDEDGNVTTDATQVRRVQITLVARAGDEVPVLAPKHTDKKTYRNQLGSILLAAQNDGFRRFLLSTEVECRNLGLE